MCSCLAGLGAVCSCKDEESHCPIAFLTVPCVRLQLSVRPAGRIRRASRSGANHAGLETAPLSPPLLPASPATLTPPASALHPAALPSPLEPGPGPFTALSPPLHGPLSAADLPQAADVTSFPLVSENAQLQPNQMGQRRGNYFRCRCCSIHFKEKETLIRHFRHKHTNTGNFQCSVRELSAAVCAGGTVCASLCVYQCVGQ